MTLSFLVSGCQTMQEESARDYEKRPWELIEDYALLTELSNELSKSEASEIYYGAYYSKFCTTLNGANKKKYIKMYEVATEIYFNQPIKATASEERKIREYLDLTWKITAKDRKELMCNVMYTSIRIHSPDLFL